MFLYPLFVHWYKRGFLYYIYQYFSFKVLTKNISILVFKVKYYT
jgi:hypothetical protein